MNLELLTMPVLFMDYLFSRLSKLNIRSLDIEQCFIVVLDSGNVMQHIVTVFSFFREPIKFVVRIRKNYVL